MRGDSEPEDERKRKLNKLRLEVVQLDTFPASLPVESPKKDWTVLSIEATNFRGPWATRVIASMYRQCDCSLCAFGQEHTRTSSKAVLLM